MRYGPEPRFLSLDFGSSASRAVIFTATGAPVWQTVKAHFPAEVGSGGEALPPELVQETLRDLLRRAGGSGHASGIAGVGVSAQLGLALLDADGRVLGPITTWMDRRAVEEARWFCAEFGLERIYRLTGRRPDPETPAAKLLRLRRERPARLDRIGAVLSLKDYVVFLLTGNRLTDPAHASYSMLLDVVRGEWADEILNAIGLPRDALPAIYPGTAVAGSLRGEIAQGSGLPAGIPVAVGGPDGTVAAVGAGMERAGVSVDVMGTSDVLLVATGTPRFHPQGATLVNLHVLPGLWVAGGPMTTTGGALQWMVEALFGCAPADVAARLAELEADARHLPPGAQGLFAIPSLVGERAPFWDAQARGALVGLDLGHRAAHLYRALVEGAAFLLRSHVEALREADVSVEQVILAGGGSRSRLACQVRSDVLGRPVAVCPVQETTGLGAAVLAATAVGYFPSVDAARTRMTHPGEALWPDPGRAAAYDDLYAAFRRIHDALRRLGRERR